jgi:cell division protein FtsB
MFTNKRSIKKILQDRSFAKSGIGYIWLFVALFTSFSLLLWNITREVSKGYREKEKIKFLSSEVSKLEEENKQLHRQLDYSKSDIAAEEGARNILGMSHEDEELIFVNEKTIQSIKENEFKTNQNNEEIDESKEPAYKSSYWSDWLNLLLE